MEFGAVPLDAALGAILAHSHEVPGGRLRKGRVLDVSDVEALRAAGLETVVVARPAPGEVGENAAATALAAALAPDPSALGLRAVATATGRVNLLARGFGLAGVDVARVTALNMADPGLTLATLAPFAPVAPDTIVATVKVIPWAVPGEALARACAGSEGAVRVHPLLAVRACLVQTRLPGLPERLLDKGARATAARLSRFGVTLAGTHVVDHATAPLARALALGAAEAPLVLLLTASATSDRADTGPAALVDAGGRLERFGVPVDPGNLTFWGRLGAAWVVGLPGSSRSPVRSGADRIVERLACGLVPDAQEIAALGAGGLLKEVPGRPHPRARAGTPAGDDADGDRTG